MAEGSSYVYIYFHPVTGYPCYVGKGTNGRWLKHNLGKGGNSRLTALINKYGECPSIIFREGLTDREAFEIEEALTHAVGLKEEGGPLLNYGHGGRGGPSGVKHSEEWRQVRSQRAKEAWENPEVRAKYLRPNRARSGNKQPRSNEFKTALSKRMIGNKYTLGKKLSDHQKAVVRERILGSIWFTDGSNNLRICPGTLIPHGYYPGKTEFYRKPLSNEQKAKQIAAISVALTGRALDEGHKDRISAGLQRRKQLGLPVGPPRKHPLVEKNCAWCGKLILTRESKKCCSVSCSNLYRTTMRTSVD